MSDDLIKRLRCGAPSEESWCQLAARTNRERAEAANRIEELERKNAELEKAADTLSQSSINLYALLISWDTRARNALPADAMLINKHIRELKEAYFDDKTTATAAGDRGEIVAYMHEDGRTISVRKLNEGLNRQDFVQQAWKNAIPLVRAHAATASSAERIPHGYRLVRLQQAAYKTQRGAIYGGTATDNVTPLYAIEDEIDRKGGA